MITPKSLTARIEQTVTTFSNWPRLLIEMAIRRTPMSKTTILSRDLTFKTRDGVVIVCPNALHGTTTPVYELFVEDAYRFNDLAGELRADFRALDIGAQVGCFSVALAKAFPQARISAYEASPTTAGYTQRNVTNNRLDDRVKVHTTALSDHVGTLQFADNGQGSALNGLTAPDDSEIIEVACTTFAGAVEAAGGEIDLVKIDTEGAEYSIVLSSDPNDWATVQSLVLEYHPVPGHSWDELREFFLLAGLEEVHHKPSGGGLGSVWLKRRSN